MSNTIKLYVRPEFDLSLVPVPAADERDWFRRDEKIKDFAALNPSLLAANSLGYYILSPAHFTVTWDGDTTHHAVLEIHDAAPHCSLSAYAAFGSFTIQSMFLPRTGNVGDFVWIKGIANELDLPFTCMEGLVESWWTPAMFGLVFLMNKAGSFTVEKGQPLAQMVLFKASGGFAKLDICDWAPRPLGELVVRKLILKNFLSPGDILMLTSAVRDLHLTFPGEFQTDVRTPNPQFWENNPYITSLADDDPDVEAIDCAYPLIHQSNDLPYHFIHAFRHFLSEKLGVNIRPHAFKGDIHLSEQEKKWRSQVAEITDVEDTRYWIIVSGGKHDFTAKWWDPARCQEVVDHFKDRILFVQCGGKYDDHTHKDLNGVINLVGKTDLRQMTRLMYHADGVICPVTMFMHLAAAVETKPGRPKNRPCVVVAGGREPSQWEAYPHHQYLHRNGCLPCCDNGGCWRSRVLPLGDGKEQDNSLCQFPVRAESGTVIPKCLDMVTAADVISSVENYIKYGSYAWRTIYSADLGPVEPVAKAATTQAKINQIRKFIK